MRASRFRAIPIIAAGTLSLLMGTRTAAAQQPAPAPPAVHQHQHEPTTAGASSSRDGSGTSWLPDASPMYAIHRQQGPWQFMLHGNGFLQYLNEGGDRGSDQFGSINWIMGMAERNAGPGRLALRGMFSFEPGTIGGCGYPDLLATGELCDGEKIHDLQHQHDLFMEVAAMYDAPLRGGLRWQVYGGPAGEPALGPVAYPHRISAMPNLLAPIAHHWLDATHITFGVITGGVYGNRWKAEASAFNGREPDEHRTGFDFAPLDSVSGRVWYLPAENLALQVSGGRLNEAEPGEGDGPRVDVTRLTASATYHRLRDEDGIWASTIAWGRNTEAGQATNALLLETNLTIRDRHSWFGRFEIAGKSAHDLDVPGDHHAEGEEVFTLSKLQGGYTRYFDAWQDLKPGIGFTASFSIVPRALEAVYGNRVNPGVGVFLTLRPAAMRMPMAHEGAATPAPEVPAAPAVHVHAPAAPAAQTQTPAAPVTPPAAADPHAAHAAPPVTTPAAAPKSAAKPAAKPADPHAGHAAPAPSRRAPSRMTKPAPKPAVKPQEATDPVCARKVDPETAPSTTYKGKTYYFCSAADRLRFLRNPETHIKGGSQ